MHQLSTTLRADDGGKRYRLSRARDVPALARVASMQGRVLRPGLRGIRIRLRELVDCHLEAANDYRGHTKAPCFLGRIVEHVLECSDVGSISHMFLRTISHKLLKKILSSDAHYYVAHVTSIHGHFCSRSLAFNGHFRVTRLLPARWSATLVVPRGPARRHAGPIRALHIGSRLPPTKVEADKFIPHSARCPGGNGEIRHSPHEAPQLRSGSGIPRIPDRLDQSDTRWVMNYGYIDQSSRVKEVSWC
jgi:hypothetical protein